MVLYPEPKIVNIKKLQKIFVKVYKIKIGVIGAGYISQVCHLPFLKKNNNCEIKAIIEKNENLLNKVADKYKIKNRFKNYQEIVEKKFKIRCCVYLCK